VLIAFLWQVSNKTAALTHFYALPGLGSTRSPAFMTTGKNRRRFFVRPRPLDGGGQSDGNRWHFND
jgi:hypothetical protein